MDFESQSQPNQPYAALDEFLYNEMQNETASNDTMDTQISNDPESVQNTETLDGPTTPREDGTDKTSLVSDFETPRKSRKRPGSTPHDNSDILREFLNRKAPNPVDFLPPPPPPPPPKDNLQHFFDAIASTMRTFSPLSVAKIKLKISQLVGEEEIANAENAESHVEFVYIESPRTTETITLPPTVETAISPPINIVLESNDAAKNNDNN